MHLDLKHTYSKEEATARIKKVLADRRKDIPKEVSIDEERWDGNTLHFAFTAQGQHISGQLEVKDKEYVIDAKLPFMLRLFEGRIEKEIEKQVKKML